MAELTERELRDTVRSLDSRISRLNSAINVPQGPRYIMGLYQNDTDDVSKERYAKAKARLDELLKQITVLEEEKKSYQTKLNTIDATKNAEKTKTDIEKKQKDLAFAKDIQDDTKVAKLEAEIKGLQDKVKPGNIAADDVAEGSNLFEKDVIEKGLKVTTNPNNGESYVSGEEGGDQVPQYIYIGEESRPTETVGGKLRRGPNSTPYTPSTADFDTLRKRIIDDAIKSSTGLKGLFDDLRAAGLKIPQSDYNRLDTTSTSFGLAISYALQKHTKTMINDLEFNKNIQPKSFSKYLREDLKDSDAGGPQVSYDEYATKRDEADSDLNRFFIENLGRGASNEELNKYYKDLRALEKKNIQVTTTTDTDSGGNKSRVSGEKYLDPDDILELQSKIAGKALDGSDIDVILKSGSSAASLINGVIVQAKNYGVVISNKDAKAYIAEQLRSGTKGDVAKVKSKLLALSKATYSNLSDVLSDDVSLKELAGNYRYNMAKVLEINEDGIDTLDPTIQTALKNNGNKGTMNLADFDRLLRSDPRWGQTNNAKEEASKYAYDILKDFGLMA